MTEILEGGAAALGLVRERDETAESFNDRIRNGLAMVGAEACWRCEVCQKWSHAKRRPPHHERFIQNTEDDGTEFGVDRPARDTADRAGLAVLREVEPREVQTAVDDFDYDPGGVWVRCGPFRPYIVVPDFNGRTAELLRRGDS